MMKNITHIPLLLLMLLTVSIVSCKKEDPEKSVTTNPTTSPKTEVEKGTLLFHLHGTVDVTEIDGYDIVYTSEADRKISIKLAQFYISEIQLEKIDGTLYDVANRKFLKTLDTDTYVVGDVPAGNYKSVRFKVGLPAATNAENPARSADSIILNRAEMWFSSTVQPDGYAFVNIQGSIDTSADLSGKMAAFIYKIGSNVNYIPVIMPTQNFTIVHKQTEFVHMYADYNKLFTGITLNNTNMSITTVTDNNSTIAAKIVKNIPSMFQYEN